MSKLWKYIATVGAILLLGTYLNQAQTCCSGGVPLSGNIGFESGTSGSLQMELSYDLNYLANLKNGSEVYLEGNRRRITQSLLLKSGYQITPWLAVDALFTYVFQERKIVLPEQVDQVQTHGLGDALLMARFVLSNISLSGTELQVGLGPKFPLGKSDLKDERGITLNADLQPGSGSWDAITWIFMARQLNFRPATVVSARVVGRINGTNREYLGTQRYQFGNSLQFYLGVGDQQLWGRQVFTPSLSLRYRYSSMDQINERDLDNTGGQWLYVLPALSWHLNTRAIFHLIPELPVFSRVGGTQLSPTFRMQAGFYLLIGQNKRKNKVI